MRVRIVLPVLVFAMSSVSVLAQSSTQVSSAQAIAIVQHAQTALGGSLVISDVTLTGSATRTVGSDAESGNFTLKALGGAQSRFDLVETGGTRTEIFNLSSEGTPEGFWNGTDGVSHAIANHNCYAGEVWFFPALSVLSQLSNPNVVVSYIGTESKNSITVQHVRFVLAIPSLPAADAARLSPLSTTDVYVNSSTFLPVAITFNQHPDDNLSLNIPVEIDYSDYKQIQGVQIPFQIQKSLNGSLMLNLTVQNATINTGLTNSTFSAN
jgi:hypothetical protein